jgi:hypothetical protein
MKLSLNKFLLFGVLYCITHLVVGQEVVHTKAAQVVVKVKHHGRVSSFWSDKLNIFFDYSNATFTAYVDKADIHTIDSLLLKELRFAAFNNIELTGKFGIDHIETAKHDPMRFDFKGTLTYSTVNLPVDGIGELQHIDAGSIACILEFKFNLDSTVLTEKLRQEHNVENISIEVLQSLLKPQDFW